MTNFLHTTTTSKAFCRFKIHLRPYSINNTRLCLQHLFLLTKITSLAEWTFAPYFNSNWITCSRFFLQATWRGVNPFWRENSTQWPSNLLVYCFVFGKDSIPFHHKILHPQLTKMSFLIIQGTAHNKIVTQNDVETTNMLLLYLRVKKKLWKTKKNSLKLSEKLIYALDDNCYSKFWEASVKNCTFYLSTSSVKPQLCHQRELIFQVTKPHPSSCISVSTAIQQ